MIAANELRIGNWVKHMGLDVCLAGHGIALCADGELIYEPIHLTPEILEKAGFIFSNYIYKHKKTQHNFALHDENRLKPNQFLFMYAENHCAFWAVDVEYLHQLQNLYFDVTKEELSIDL